MFGYINKRAQSTAEYVIVLGLIVAAVLAMQTYIKRGFQGRIKDAVDFVDNANQTGNVITFTANYQYEPYYLSSEFDTKRNTEGWEALQNQGAVSRNVTQEFTNRIGNQTIANEKGAD